ncbi:transcriptional regulator, PucR family [Desulfotomaculum nigrificans CO-1-SRB]|uniref:Transcriptional regulator, PucR family n=1 Tax=Desulfotomaculum nigrificans (strain DSM 14880 / VKM B-2319 / CO-1-SRB) TaxID=868595 RepID=F6B860_DESCC|nr:PucR family transcriptional regulator [Desulfotomaculum nigrificans]AEF93505.1 transcriptional regulator, PucR family [Desulfotomaculum nigrificans CO-1-SRB]
MGITVQDALSLDVLKGARLIAGAKGLERVIKRVSVLECPDCDEYKGLLREGDFFLTSFYAFKDDEPSLFTAVETLIESGSSGLCVLDLYMEDLPTELKQLADREKYPIVMISKDLPYADVITDIMDLIIQNKENIITEMQVDQLLQAGSDKNKVRSIAYQINPRFSEHILAIYCTGDATIRKISSRIQEKFNGKDSWAVLPYRQGILLLISFMTRPEDKRLTNELNSVIDTIKGYADQCPLGISRLYTGLENIGLCIKEAMLAGGLGEKVLGRQVTRYQDLGVYRVLAIIQDAPEVKAFHDEIIMPLLDYDSKNHTNLFKTAVAYIDNDGDINRTAQELFQHANTVRYRLTKIKEILQMEALEGSFYEQLSVAVKIHKLL